MNPTNNNNLYSVKDIALAAYLVTAGHACRKIEPDFERPGLKVFYFDNTREIMEEVRIYKLGTALAEPKGILIAVRNLKGGLVYD